MTTSSKKPARLPAAGLAGMAEVLKVLAHADRLRIVELLDLAGEQPVHAIVADLAQPQGSVSGQLNKMRRAGLITARRQGKEVWYRLANPHVLTILNCIRTKGCPS